MKLTNSLVASDIVKTIEHGIGTLFFFNHLAVVEFNEGAHVDLISAERIIYDLVNYFGQSRPFGLVANRINSYSISMLDVQDIKPALPNMIAYGVVSHNHAGNMNAKIEDDFCKTQKISYTDLYECMNSVYERVKEGIMISLN